MLEKPQIADQEIISCLQDAYGLQVQHFSFLPVGYDVYTAAYRVESAGAAFFLKVRMSSFDENAVKIPLLLKHQGLEGVITPLKARDGRYWAGFDSNTLILYPFIAGQDGYQMELTDRQWTDFGAYLNILHCARLPEDIAQYIPVEQFSPTGREAVSGFQNQIRHTIFHDPVAAKLADFMCSSAGMIRQMVDRANYLGQKLQKRSLPVVLCHGDMHAGNLLITNDGTVYIVDWDNLIFAPKELDLMFAGAGLRPMYGEREEALFFQGYGRCEVDLSVLAYYRYERIIQDIAAFCQQVFTARENGEDGEMAYGFFTGMFGTNREVDYANWTYNKLIALPGDDKDD